MDERAILHSDLIEEEFQPQFDRNLDTLKDLMDKLSPFTAPLMASQEASDGEES